MLPFSFPVDFLKIRNQVLSLSMGCMGFIPTNSSPGPIYARPSEGLQNSENAWSRSGTSRKRGKTSRRAEGWKKKKITGEKLWFLSKRRVAGVIWASLLGGMDVSLPAELLKGHFRIMLECPRALLRVTAKSPGDPQSSPTGWLWDNLHLLSWRERGGAACWQNQ